MLFPRRPKLADWLIFIIVVVAILLALTIIWGIRAHRQRVFAGREDLIGQVAEVREALDPNGMIFVEGERWKAVSEEGSIKAGEEVIISKVKGLKLYVTKKV